MVTIYTFNNISSTGDTTSPIIEPFIIPKNPIVIAPANYYAWEFEDNLTDEGGNLTWTDLYSNSTYSPGIIGQKLNIDFSVTNQVQYRLIDPGADFLWADWTKPFAISAWISKTSYSAAGIHVQLKTNSTAVDRVTDLVWTFHFFANDLQVQIVYNASDTREGQIVDMGSLTDNQVYFIYMRYDPTNNKQVKVGLNDTAEQTLTFTNDFHTFTYDSDYSLCIANTDSASMSATLDQLVIWHTQVKTRQDMLDLYNGGAGISLANLLSPELNYVAWEFEDNMVDQTSLLTWNNLYSYPLTYPSLKVNKGVQFTAGTGDIDIFHVVDPGEEFLISWDIPWAISLWLNRPNANDIFSINLKDTNSGTRMQNVIWALGFWQQGIYLDLATNLSHTLTAQNCQFTSVSGALNFFYIRYSPAEQKKIYYGANDQAEQSKTFTNSLPFTTYNSSWTLAFGVNNTGSRTFQLDQLAFWHTQVKTRQDMLDLYNSGSGAALPS